MRQGQNKRSRGRGRKGPNPLTRSYESNGPEVKIRGTALHIADKYAQLARDAQVAGNRVQGESLLQHAEHYYRIVAAAQAQIPQPPPRNDDDGANDQERRGNGQGRERPAHQDDQPAFGLSDPQPHVNGGNGALDESAEPNASQPDQGARNEETQDKPEGSGGRPRRRRPYRDRSAEPSSETAADEAAPQPASAPVKADKGEEVASSAGDD
jgi:hypothetical protein